MALGATPLSIMGYALVEAMLAFYWTALTVGLVYFSFWASAFNFHRVLLVLYISVCTSTVPATCVHYSRQRPKTGIVSLWSIGLVAMTTLSIWVVTDREVVIKVQPFTTF